MPLRWEISRGAWLVDLGGGDGAWGRRGDPDHAFGDARSKTTTAESEGENLAIPREHAAVVRDDGEATRPELTERLDRVLGDAAKAAPPREHGRAARDGFAPFPNEMDMSVQEVLMEGLRQIDEFNELREQLPELHTRLVMPVALTPKLSELKPTELDVLQLVHNHGHLESVLNKSSTTDLEPVQVVLALIKRKYIRPE